MSDIPPGYYPAAGDPAGTVRRWDGAQWVGGPISNLPGMAVNNPSDRYGTVGVRIGATLLDGVIGMVVILPFMLPDLIDSIEEVQRTNEASSFSLGIEIYGLSLALTAAFVVMVATLGGTPGKLMLGLRITTEDSATTPPGFRRATMRAVPAVLGAIPIVGALISTTVVILSLVWVSNDPERRSPYDRIANTRVVYKTRL